MNDKTGFIDGWGEGCSQNTSDCITSTAVGEG